MAKVLQIHIGGWKILLNKAKSWEDKQNKYTNTFIESTKYKKLISKNLEKVWSGESVGMPFKNNENTLLL